MTKRIPLPGTLALLLLVLSGTYSLQVVAEDTPSPDEPEITASDKPPDNAVAPNAGETSAPPEAEPAEAARAEPAETARAKPKPTPERPKIAKQGGPRPRSSSAWGPMLWLDGGYGMATGSYFVSAMESGFALYFFHGPTFGAMVGVARTGGSSSDWGIGYDASFLLVSEDDQRVLFHRHSLAAAAQLRRFGLRGGVGWLATNELYCPKKCKPTQADCSDDCFSTRGLSLFLTPSIKLPISSKFAFQVSLPLSLAGLIGIDFQASLRIGLLYL